MTGYQTHSWKCVRFQFFMTFVRSKIISEYLAKSARMRIFLQIMAYGFEPNLPNISLNSFPIFLKMAQIIIIIFFTNCNNFFFLIY